MEAPPLHEALLEAIDAVTSFCAENGLDYAFMGGLALQAWSRQRATRDVDLLVALGDVREADFLDKMVSKGFRLQTRRMLGESVWLRFLFSPSRLPVEIEVDVFPASGDYQTGVVRGARSLEVLGRSWKVVRPEDLIIQKLVSDRILDRADTEALVEDQKERLDWDYLDFWANRLGLSRALGRLRGGQP